MFSLGSHIATTVLAERIGATINIGLGNQVVVRNGQGFVFFRPGLLSARLLNPNYLEISAVNLGATIDLREHNPDLWYNKQFDLFLSSSETDQFMYLGKSILGMHEQGPEGQRVGLALGSPLSRESWRAINLDSDYSVEYNHHPSTISQIKPIVSETMVGQHDVTLYIRILDYSGCRLSLYLFGKIGSLLYMPLDCISALGVCIRDENDNRIERFVVPGNEPVEMYVKHLIPVEMACRLFLRYLFEGSSVFQEQNLIPQ